MHKKTAAVVIITLGWLLLYLLAKMPLWGCEESGQCYPLCAVKETTCFELDGEAACAKTNCADLF